LETRGAVSGELFERGMDFYAKGKYEEAAAALEGLVEASGESPGMVSPEEPGAGDATQRRLTEDLDSAKLDQALLYLGVCHLLEKDPAGAIVYLQRASRSRLPVVSDRATWYLAQANLRANNPEAAARNLGRLAGSSPGYGAEARRQLDALTDLLGNGN